MNSSNNHSYNTIELILYFICIKTYKLLGTRILEIPFTSSIIKCKKSLLERIIGHVPSCIIRTTCDSLCRFYFLNYPFTSYETFSYIFLHKQGNNTIIKNRKSPWINFQVNDWPHQNNMLPLYFLLPLIYILLYSLLSQIEVVWYSYFISLIIFASYFICILFESFSWTH